jgi:hypothetical protein
VLATAGGPQALTVKGGAKTGPETASGAGVAYPRPRPAWPMAHRRGRRTGHPGLVHGHTTSRLYGYLGDLPPAEFEGRFHDTQQAATAWSKSNTRASTRPSPVQASSAPMIVFVSPPQQ